LHPQVICIIGAGYWREGKKVYETQRTQMSPWVGLK
jgi:hypothetical protein